MPKRYIQATGSEGLARGLYMAAGMGFEPANFQTQDTEPTTEPPSPNMHSPHSL